MEVWENVNWPARSIILVAPETRIEPPGSLLNRASIMDLAPMSSPWTIWIRL